MSTSRPSSPLKSPRFRPYTPTSQAPANLDLTAQPQPSLTQTSSDTSATLNNNTTIDLSTSSSPSPAPEPPTFLAQLEQRWHETYEKLNQAEQECNIISRISPDITLDRFHVEKARNRYAYFQKQESSLREDIRRLTPRPMDPHFSYFFSLVSFFLSVAHFFVFPLFPIFFLFLFLLFFLIWYAVFFRWGVSGFPSSP
ncbi:MAG: hypothetical protein J3R72DRAFT_37033 [Linnemannia gamsii]|nr:MAG: hypothetical protein J3R72DRAFT_37033 [Linnemannia gamsii]